MLLILLSFLAVVAGVVGMSRGFQKIESMHSPTPRDLAGAVQSTQILMLAGFMAGLIGLVLLTIAVINLLRPRPDLSSSSSYAVAPRIASDFNVR